MKVSRLEMQFRFTYLLRVGAWEQMMSNVVKIGGIASAETVEDFVRRRGSVTSHEVGRRFGWTYEDAHRHMKKLQRQGVVHGETEKSMVNGGGRDFCWSIRKPSE